MTAGIIQHPHTAMIRVTARLRETRIYLQNINIDASPGDETKRAWNENWFGFPSENIFHRYMPTFHNRFVRYPQSVRILKRWLEYGMAMPDLQRVVHFHIQLTDPYYRWATGSFFPERRNDGFLDVPNSALSAALNEHTQKKYKGNTLAKLAQNILTTARDTGLLTGTNEKCFATMTISPEALGYMVYMIKNLGFPSRELPESPYFRSVFRSDDALRAVLAQCERKKYWEFDWIGDHFSIHHSKTELTAWAEEHIR
jgi:hypothetical protein